MAEHKSKFMGSSFRSTQGSFDSTERVSQASSDSSDRVLDTSTTKSAASVRESGAQTKDAVLASSRFGMASFRGLGITGRNLAFVAVTMICVCRGDQKYLIEMQKGGVYNELKVSRNKKLEEDPDLTLVKISYCQRSLSETLLASSEYISAMVNDKLQDSKAISTGLQDEEIKEVKDLVNHDFLVLELKHPGEATAQNIHIIAQKFGRGPRARGEEPPEGEDALVGIMIEELSKERFGREVHEDVILHEIECNTKLNFKSIINELTKERADYSVRDANCWDYARNTTKLLLEECIRQSRTSASERRRLQDEHDNLESKLREKHIIDTANRLKEWLLAKATAVKDFIDL